MNNYFPPEQFRLGFDLISLFNRFTPLTIQLAGQIEWYSEHCPNNRQKAKLSLVHEAMDVLMGGLLYTIEHQRIRCSQYYEWSGQNTGTGIAFIFPKGTDESVEEVLRRISKHSKTAPEQNSFVHQIMRVCYFECDFLHTLMYSARDLEPPADAEPGYAHALREFVQMTSYLDKIGAKWQEDGSSIDESTSINKLCTYVLVPIRCKLKEFEELIDQTETAVDDSWTVFKSECLLQLRSVLNVVDSTEQILKAYERFLAGEV